MLSGSTEGLDRVSRVEYHASGYIMTGIMDWRRRQFDFHTGDEDGSHTTVEHKSP